MKVVIELSAERLKEWIREDDFAKELCLDLPLAEEKHKDDCKECDDHREKRNKLNKRVRAEEKQYSLKDMELLEYPNFCHNTEVDFITYGNKLKIIKIYE